MPAASRISAFGKVPQIVMNVYRVIAFRSTLDIGELYTLSVAEVLVTCAYIAALFVWSFIDSENSLLDVCLINILTRDIATNPTTGRRFDSLFIESRTGVIGAYQFPLITALGMKNNFISCERTIRP